MSNSENLAKIWQWKTWQDSTYLTCSLLSPWQHGFFSQQFYPHLPENLTAILNADSRAYRVKQVHGNSILTTQEIEHFARKKGLVDTLLDSDGVMSDRPLESVWAASADCTPILIGDVITNRVCAIHAGWRGTAQKIVVAAIARFIELGSKKEDLRIAIGPAITGKVYQVDDHVAVEVGMTVVENLESDVDIISKLRQLPISPVIDDDLPGKVRLDIPRINYIQLTQLNINPEQIAIAPYCTYQQSDLFFSYRRTKEKKVQWSGILSAVPRLSKAGLAADRIPRSQ